MRGLPIPLPVDGIADFCRRWKVTELALFGSVLRADFDDASDVDVMVTFSDEATWSALDLVAAADELAELLGRRVDLVEKSALRNPFRRHAILHSAQVVYAA
jgi:predicted nucleotidyltransferase